MPINLNSVDDFLWVLDSRADWDCLQSQESLSDVGVEFRPSGPSAGYSARLIQAASEASR